MVGTATREAKQQEVGVLLLHVVEHLHVAKHLKSSEIGSCGRSQSAARAIIKLLIWKPGAALVPTRDHKNPNQLPFDKKKNAV